MKNVIKLTGITGGPLYIRDGFSIFSLAAMKDNQMSYTEVFTLGAVFRVKETCEEVAEMIGWEAKQIANARANLTDTAR